MDEKKKDLGEVREALRVCARADEHSWCEECPLCWQYKCISALIEGAEDLVEYYEEQLVAAEAEKEAG